MNGEFVISLDFELLWGVRDVADRNTYGKNILGGREAIRRILSLFELYGIRATWATVGFLFCESKEELLESLPPAELRPNYSNKGLSSYNYFDEIGSDEKSDPYYFAPSLIKLISETPGQEIATHTMSHYYCLEQGQTDATFEADLQAAIALGKRRGLAIRSIVFPRNQYAQAHLDICLRNGITAFRGNPLSWPYRPTNGAKQSLLRRGLRLADAHSGIFSRQSYTPLDLPLRNVPAISFLRPCTGLLSRIHPLHILTIKAGMTKAAKSGQGYHLWWHPHNFGRETEANLVCLKQLLDHYSALRSDYGMVSRSMGVPETIRSDAVCRSVGI